MTYATLETLLAHYVQMAALDKAYAWKRAKDLAAASSMYADLPRLLTEAMNAEHRPAVVTHD